jgi:hypothetical protein
MADSHAMATLRRDRRCGIANQRAQGVMIVPSATARPWRLPAVPIPKSVRIRRPKSERAGMHKQSLEHVLVSWGVHASKPTCLVEMRARSFKRFPALAEEPLSAVAANPTSIGIDRVAFRLFGRSKIVGRDRVR